MKQTGQQKAPAEAAPKLAKSKRISKQNQRMSLIAKRQRQQKSRPKSVSQRTMEDFVSVKQTRREQAQPVVEEEEEEMPAVAKIGFSTPTKHRKSFKQAKLEVKGKQIRIYQGYDSSVEQTAATQASRGRPRKSTPRKKPSFKIAAANRRAKVAAGSVIKQLYDNSRSKDRLFQNNHLFYL